MNSSLIKTVARMLRECADRLDGGNTELSESEAMDVMSALCHRVMSKETACKYLNLSKSRFDDYVRMKKLPKGKKRVGFKEVVWYQDEIDRAVEKMKGKNQK